MKIKNSKYYNEEDLKNESTRELNNELKKMKINIHNENDNNQINIIKNHQINQNYLKIKNNKSKYNPLIEEFNKLK